MEACLPVRRSLYGQGERLLSGSGAECHSHRRRAGQVFHRLCHTGRQRYGVAGSGAILDYANGKPIQALAAVFQHSPLALLVKKDSGINRLSDLRGKRVMLQPGSLNANITAMLRSAGIGDEEYSRQEISYNIQSLIAGDTDAYSVYVTDQPHQLKMLGIPYNIFYPSDYGIEFYGDILITSDEEIRKHPQRTHAFIEASLQGWVYALEHIDETIELIQTNYNTQNFSSGQLYFEATKTIEMILKDVVSLGYMSDYRWNKIANTYAELGLMPADYNLDSFIYQPEPELTDLLNRYRWQFTIFGLLFLLLIFVLQSILLRRQVRIRTQKLMASESLQTSISKTLEMIASGVRTTEIFEEIIHIFESIYPGMRASILLVRDGKIYKGAAPNLPEEYNNAIEGLDIGPAVGSCGTAAYTKKRVIVEDIATDPLWAPYKEVALPFNLRACWSEPIISANDEVLGTFAMYYDHLCTPTEQAINDISNAARLTGIAIERDLHLAKLRKLSRAIDQAGEVITISDRKVYRIHQPCLYQNHWLSN